MPNVSTLRTAGVRGNGRPRQAGAIPLRVALVGGGKMAQHHARAVAAAGVPAEVVAVTDPSPAAREAMAAVVPDARGYATLGELLHAERPDVVHVCTPPGSHEELAMQALEGGCHVYVEKPFVPTATAAERILAAAEERGLLVCAGHQLLFEAPARRALELLPALGTLTHVESYFSFRTVRRSADGRTPLRADLQLLDILPHPVYSLLHVLEQAMPDGRSELQGVEVGPAGTVHALVRRGALTGTLVVTLEGRPVDSYLRIVGTNGSVHADFVRGTVQRLIGPGTSGIDKLLNPYRVARQLATGTTRALGARAMKRQRSYPGLAEIFGAFYGAVRGDGDAPVSPDNIRDTVRICEQVAAHLAAPVVVHAPAAETDPAAPRVAVTGGTGFLGGEVVRQLTAAGTPVLVLARREPPEWERIAGAEYRAVDLSRPLPTGTLADVDAVIHCAAATSGGWEEHQAHSLDATENIVRAAHAGGVRRLVHVSSTAVLDGNPRRPIADDSPLHADSRSQGPYVWGKLESERIAVRRGAELGVEIRVARPGAIIDDRAFDPPGKLGRRAGNVFIAVGTPSDTLGVVDVAFAARTLIWIVRHFDDAPRTINVLSPTQPTKRDMLRRLRQSNPDLRVVWFPRAVLRPVSWAAIGAQKMLRPGTPPIDAAAVFAKQRFDTTTAERLAPRIVAES
jgi:predicted dehydrogenase/nucleoside-diphosphate-sugar epimerase